MKLTNKETSSYLIWVAVNLFILLAFGELQFGSTDFYPFEGFDEIRDYDMSEFLAYTLVPFLIILAYKYSSGESLKEEMKQPPNLHEQVIELAEPLIINGYRRVALEKGVAPTFKTSDNKIMDIYSRVGSAFKEASKQRNEHIQAGYINTIVLKFIQVYEMRGDIFLEEHLKYEIDKYLIEGLRNDYKNELKLF